MRDLEVRLYERGKDSASLYEQLIAAERIKNQTTGDDISALSREYEKFEKALKASHPLELKKTDARGTFQLAKASRDKKYFIIFFAQLEDEPFYFRHLDLDTSKKVSKLAVAMNDEPCSTRDR